VSQNGCYLQFCEIRKNETNVGIRIGLSIPIQPHNLKTSWWTKNSRGFVIKKSSHEIKTIHVTELTFQHVPLFKQDNHKPKNRNDTLSIGKRSYLFSSAQPLYGQLVWKRAVCESNCEREQSWWNKTSLYENLWSMACYQILQK